MRISHDKHVAVADGTADGIAAIPSRSRLRDELGHVERGGYQCRNFRAGHARVAQVAIEVGVSFVEMVADFFQDRLGVGAENGVLAAVDEHFVELAGVGHVEVAHHHQGAGRPVAAAQVRVAAARIEIARSAVAQVADEDFTAEVEVRLNAGRVLDVHRALAGHFEEVFDLLVEDLGQSVFGDAAAAVHVRLADGHVDLDAANTGAVLTAIVLLFHEEKQLVETPQAGAVTVVIIGQRLAESHSGDPAFVFEEVAHAWINRGITRLLHKRAHLLRGPCGRSPCHRRPP